MSYISSPVTGKKNVTKHSRIQVKKIVDIYNKNYNFDVSEYFSGLDEITVYRCNDSGYKFYYPDSITGDARFYQNLYGNSDNMQWAYIEDKWEHIFTKKNLVNKGSLLDIGCGGGDFLKLMSDSGCHVTGLDTNPLAHSLANQKNLNIVNDSIYSFSKGHNNSFDTITLFQVLEHIWDVRDFLTACLSMLKPGGSLIISVPNNQSFIKHDNTLALNMPPHHVGLWERESLENLPHYFNMELVRTEFEPLQEMNLGWYQSLMEKKYLPDNKIFRSLYYRLGLNSYAHKWLSDNMGTIWGHTILSVFKKI